MHPHFEVHVAQRHDQVAVVTVRGELCFDTREVLPPVVTAALRRDTVDRVELNLADLSFLDAAGLSVLLTLHSQAQAQSKALSVSRAAGLPLRVLEITGMLGLLGGKADQATADHDHAG